MSNSWKWQDIISGAILALCGLLLILHPDAAAVVIVKAAGIVVAVIGAVFVIMYFIRRKLPGFNYNLVQGAVMIGIGLFLYFQPKAVASFLPMLFGIGVLVSGILSFQRALDLNGLGIGGSGGVMIVALINILLGILIILRPFNLAQIIMFLIGIALMYSGVTDIVTAIYITVRMSRSRVKGSAKEVPPADADDDGMTYGSRVGEEYSYSSQEQDREVQGSAQAAGGTAAPSEETAAVSGDDAEQIIPPADETTISGAETDMPRDDATKIFTPIDENRK